MRKEAVVRPRGRTLPQARCLTMSRVLIVLASCGLLPAQNVVLTGALSGRVFDASGAVVSGASVVVENLATGVEQSVVTNHAGLYQLPALMPGTYSITASLKGFRDVQVLTRVLVGNTTVENIKLPVGAGGDKVQVIGT